MAKKGQNKKSKAQTINTKHNERSIVVASTKQIKPETAKGKKENDEAQDNQSVNLEIWKTCVEMANSISIRRDKVNDFFITLNTAIIGLVIFKDRPEIQLICLAGLFFCLIWNKMITYFRILNTKKFSVINKLEEKLPSQPFNDEWELLTNDSDYKDATKIEHNLPFIFAIAYFLDFLAQNDFYYNMFLYILNLFD